MSRIKVFTYCTYVLKAIGIIEPLFDTITSTRYQIVAKTDLTVDEETLG